MDPTDDPTHGGQQLTFFNGHYDTWCYLPVAGFVQFDDEPEQYLFGYVLRPGNADAKLGAIGILIPRLRQLAGNCLILLVIAVTPANIHMWLNPQLCPVLAATVPT